jgi:hypothetical protein
MSKKREIKDSYFHKFEGIAPEGFLLVPEELFDLLKDFDNWKEFKHNLEWVYDNSKKIVVENSKKSD